MTGWLLDTNVVSELTRLGGSRRVQDWAEAQPDETLHVSILTLAEYAKGLANLPDGDARRIGIERLHDGLVARFTILPISNAIVLR